MDEQQGGRTVWQGRIGDAPLRVDMLPSGRIFAAWSIKGNERRAVVDSVQQLEQRVLFQLMLGAGPGQDVDTVPEPLLAVPYHHIAGLGRALGRPVSPDAEHGHAEHAAAVLEPLVSGQGTGPVRPPPPGGPEGRPGTATRYQRPP